MSAEHSVKLASIILAAGKGTRMKSDKAKVLHTILGRPMIEYVLKATEAVHAQQNVLVVGHNAQQVIDACGPQVSYAWQTEQKGTGHAVQMAMPSLEGFDGWVLILNGDLPLITGDMLCQLVQYAQDKSCDLAILTTRNPQLRDFGRIVRRADESVLKIVEAKDCSPEEYALDEVNIGVYCAKAEFLREFLPQFKPNNAQGELYLTDLVSLGNAAGRHVGAMVTADAQSALGVNSRADLARAAQVLNGRILHAMMLDGVTIIDPDSVWVEPGVKVGADTVLWPGTLLHGRTVIGEGCEIGPNTRITDCQVGSHTQAAYSVLWEAQVGDNVKIGPFAYLRPGTVISDNAKVGDFVEIKNSQIGLGTKVPHLTYVGDSDIGSGTNIGCGTITCNYDGQHKHRTVIGDHAFIGSNTSLVAPVHVGDGARTGAGAVITHDVPEGITVIGVPARPLKQ